MQTEFWNLRFLLAALAVAIMTLAAPLAAADDAEDRARVDALFVQLKRAPDAATAKGIDQRIWQIWLNPSDPDLAGRMREVMALRMSMPPQATIRVLDRLIEDYPDYAEGWNQRATMHYVVGDLEASLADIDKVLALEPRHFGALSGQSMIYLSQGERALALEAMRTALEFHPFLVERSHFPELNREITRI